LSARLAAEYGTAISVALFLERDGVNPVNVIEDYCHHFVCSPELPAPTWSIAVSGVCADSEHEAYRLLSSYPGKELAKMASFIGSPRQCREMIEILAQRFDTNRLAILTLCNDAEATAHSIELIADALGVHARNDEGASGLFETGQGCQSAHARYGSDGAVAIGASR
jgi:alkanesulfonate monooxygenase SsuD/methylene tetrahydromethanopterin reductase-like flavin-dependent oxidoreductase (luciferase family)